MARENLGDTETQVSKAHLKGLLKCDFATRVSV